MVTHFEDSACQANERLEQAIKLFEAEKATLTKRVEKAGKKLNPLKEKYATLLKHINEMLTTIFGMCSVSLLPMYRLMTLAAAYCTFFLFAGRKNHNLVELPIVKLKTIFTYIEQLFTGSIYSIMAMKNLKHPPRNIKDMLKQLSTVP